MPPVRHRSPEASRVPVLHRSVPDVSPPHAAPVSSATRRRAPSVHGRERRHHLHLRRQDLPLAGQQCHTEVHVVTGEKQ